MFPKNDIEQLLTKYRKGQLTSDELRYLEEWYLAWKPEKADISAEELEALKQNVWQAVDPDRGRTSGWRYWHSAATILVFLLAGVYYWLNDTHIASLQKPIVQHAKNNALFPGRDRAMLTLSNGQSIDLDQYTSGKVAQEGASVINKTADGQLNYSASGEALKTQPIVYNTLTTPRGGQYHLVLPDGTGVWLNAASSLTFPVQFNKSERVVTLRGEAYFEVSHRDRQPFKVLTSTQEIKVFGTKFDVSSYTEDKVSSTTLVSGSVQIKSISSGQQKMLKPGQQASVNNGSLTTAHVNADNIISWKNGYFLFDNQDVKEIMQVMSRWYDVDISYQGAITNERFGGSFSRKLRMNEILKNFERLGNLEFDVYGNQVLVRPKKIN